MLDFYERRKIKGLVFSRMTAGALFGLALLLSMATYNRYAGEQDTRIKREARVEELQKLKERALLLESKVNHIESERGVEGAIREQFDVAKEGEEVVVVVDKDATRTEEVVREVYPLPPRKTLFERLFFW
jgi:uncharacterized membrane protein YhiD involved in acid resistance